MATPRRRVRNTPSRATLTPRRKMRPGMGGANPGQQKRRPGGLWQGLPQQPPAGAQPGGGVLALLRELGLQPPQQGFGFAPRQQAELAHELAMIRQAGGQRPQGFNWQQGQGIAGNLGRYEQALDINPHRIAPLGASQDQRQQFGQTFGGGSPPQAGGQFGPPPPPPGGGHPGPQAPQQQQVFHPQQQGPPGGQQGPPPGPPAQTPYAHWQPPQNFQIPGWNQAVQGYYNEIPQQPAYLSGQGVAEQQAYMNALRNNLAGLQSQYGQVAPQVNQQLARLGTDYGVQRQQLAGQYADNGIFESGIARSGFQNQVTDYNRQQQDLMQAAQAQLANLYGQAGGQFGNTQANLLDLYRQEAAQAAANPYTPYGGGPRRRKR